MSNIKVIVKKGKEPGKKLVILAGIHGNEICGVKAFDKLIPELEIKKGQVTFIYANLEAMKQNKRFVEANLNRCFFTDQPEEIANTLEGKTSKEIMPYLEEADSMFDIHSTRIKDSIPFIISGKKDSELIELFPFEVVSYNWDDSHPGSTDYYMNLQGKDSVVIECGYHLDPKTQEIAENSILNFLRYFDAIDGECKRYKDKRLYKIIGMFKNKKYPFKKQKDFTNFETCKEKTLIGKEGEEEIYCNQGEAVIFVHDADELDQECFVIAREEQ